MTNPQAPLSAETLDAAYAAMCDEFNAIAAERGERMFAHLHFDAETTAHMKRALSKAIALPSKATVKGEEETLLKWQKEYGHYDYEPSWAKTPFGEYRAEYMENSGGTKWHVRLAYCTGNFGTTYDPQLHFPTREQAQAACEKDFANRLRPYIATLAHPSPQDSGEGFYVASRASLPERGQMWRDLRATGVKVNSTWIDEDGPKASRDLSDLWSRIRDEVVRSEALILYAEPEDFPQKGALVEVGMAMSAGVPIRIVAPLVHIQERNCRPFGSWIKHPSVSFHDTIQEAVSALPPSPSSQGIG